MCNFYLSVTLQEKVVLKIALLRPFFFLNFLFYLGVHSSVTTCAPMKPRAGTYRTVWLKGWVFIAHKFRIVEMDNWLNLNKRPCWDSIHDPFASEANPWTARLRYLILVCNDVLSHLHASKDKTCTVICSLISKLSHQFPHVVTALWHLPCPTTLLFKWYPSFWPIWRIFLD